MTAEQERLVTENLRLASYFASKYARCGIAFDELYSMACLGLTKAALKFDPAKGKFSTIAGLCIKQEFDHALRLAKAKKRTAVVLSIDAPIGEDENLTLQDVIPDSEEPFPERLERLEEESQALADLEICLTKLGKRERLVLCEKYGLGRETPKTQTAIAREIHVRPSTVSRCLKSGVENMQNLMQTEGSFSP